jgi:adenosylhomocysteine nucleosidase
VAHILEDRPRQVVAGAALLVAVVALAWALLGSGSGFARGAGVATLAPVGIESAFSVEQAPVLAEMKVTGSRKLDGLTFYTGTIGGVAVVDVQTGEINEQAELATYILDTTFHPRAVLYSGTAGAQENDVHVGDVVLSGFVDDKSGIHYYLGGAQQPYGGAEVQTTDKSDLKGSVFSYSEVTPATPKTAAGYGYGPSTKDRSIKMVSVFAAPKALVNLGMQASAQLGTTPLWDATSGKAPAAGSSAAAATVTNKTVAGVVGDADVWTEPLSWIAAQNALYPTDAEENEGVGFAFTNAQLGVPWLLVRGISDSVWYPNAYDGPLASEHAATVVKYVVTHLPARLSTAPETLGGLSAQSNARRYGYLVASQAYYKVSPVSKIVVGKSTVTSGKLRVLDTEYAYSAGGLK